MAVQTLDDITRLTRRQVAWRTAHDIEDGWYVNLGIGMPTMCSNYLPEDALDSSPITRATTAEASEHARSCSAQGTSISSPSMLLSTVLRELRRQASTSPHVETPSPA